GRERIFRGRRKAERPCAGTRRCPAEGERRKRARDRGQRVLDWWEQSSGYSCPSARSDVTYSSALPGLFVGNPSTRHLAKRERSHHPRSERISWSARRTKVAPAKARFKPRRWGEWESLSGTPRNSDQDAVDSTSARRSE